MDILKNPFHILGATTQNNRYRIMELEEERSLLSDADECMEARSILINPRRRISAEVAWLPGVDPGLSNELLNRLDTPNQNLLNITGLTHVARANLLVSGLSRLPNLSSANIVEWTLAIAQASEAINSEMVRAILNEDRKTSGFPEITDLSAIDDEIRKEKNYYRQVLTSVLESLSVTERARVLTLVIERSTGNNKFRCPILIEDLILPYELGVQDSLEQNKKIIEALDEKLRAMVDAKNPDTILQPIVNQLIQAVKEWDTLAQPIQLNKKSRGERHTASFDIAWRVRGLAIDLFNEYGKLDFSRKIINMLKEVFAEVIEVDERITEDSAALEKQEILIRNFEKFENIATQVEKIKETLDAKRPDYTLAPMVTQLIQTVKTWNTATQPDEANNAIAIIVRGIALHLWNEHEKLYYSIQITEALLGVFQRVNEVTHRLSEDLATLYEIRYKINQQEKRADTGCLLQIVIFAALGLIGALLQGC